MTFTQKVTLAIFILTAPLTARATAPIAPEIDGTGLMITLGILVSSIALLRDKFKK